MTDIGLICIYILIILFDRAILQHYLINMVFHYRMLCIQYHIIRIFIYGFLVNLLLTKINKVQGDLTFPLSHV